jgi:hypothetical protein
VLGLPHSKRTLSGIKALPHAVRATGNRPTIRQVLVEALLVENDRFSNAGDVPFEPLALALLGFACGQLDAHD